MKVYKGISEVSSELARIEFKKSGYNKFSDFRYFQLEDFMPSLLALCTKHGLCSFVSFTEEQATLTVVSVEDDSTVSISCPKRNSTMKGMTLMQEEGAVQTYARRYLYMSMFGITEGDVLDSTVGSPNVAVDEQVKATKKTATKKSSQPQSEEVKESVAVDKELIRTTWNLMLQFFNYNFEEPSSSDTNTKAREEATRWLSETFGGRGLGSLTEEELNSIPSIIQW